MLSSACPHPQWSPSSAPLILPLAEGTWRKCLRNPCWCSVYVCVSHSPDGCVFPQAGHIQGFNAVLCIRYRPIFNNGGLTSGPRTRISAAGQETLSLWFWGLSPQYLAASGDHDSVQCPTVSCSRGEACVLSGGAHCAPLCLPFGTPGLPPPPFLLPSPTPCTMLLLCLLQLRIYHPGCIATCLVSFISPSPPTKLPEL